MRDLRSAGRFGLRIVLLAILAWACPTRGWCQGSLGGLTGHVTDPSGAVVAGVSIQIINLQSGEVRLVVSTADGTYLAPGLTPGRVPSHRRGAGLKTVTQEPVDLSTATISTLDFSMQVGEVTESISVSGGGVELQTTSAEIGTVMPEKGILDLPISLGKYHVRHRVRAPADSELYLPHAGRYGRRMGYLNQRLTRYERGSSHGWRGHAEHRRPGIHRRNGSAVRSGLRV